MSAANIQSLNTAIQNKTKLRKLVVEATDYVLATAKSQIESSQVDEIHLSLAQSLLSCPKLEIVSFGTLNIYRSDESDS